MCRDVSRLCCLLLGENTGTVVGCYYESLGFQQISCTKNCLQHSPACHYLQGSLCLFSGMDCATVCCNAKASAGEAAAAQFWCKASIPSSPENNPCCACNTSDCGIGTLCSCGSTLARKLFTPYLAIHCHANCDAHMGAVTSFISVHREGKQDHISQLLCSAHLCMNTSFCSKMGLKSVSFFKRSSFWQFLPHISDLVLLVQLFMGCRLEKVK